MTRTAEASARKCRQHITGADAYKPMIKYPNGRTEVVAQAGCREQGATYLDRAEAVTRAQALIDLRLAEVLSRAGRWPAKFAAKVQGEFELWGGSGDVVAASRVSA